MDIQTLTVVTSVTAATMAVALGAMARFSPADGCLRDWALAGVLFLANSLLGIVALSAPLPPGVVVVANACTVTGYLLVVTGMRRYLGRTPGHGWVLALALIMLFLQGLPAVRSSLALRLLIGWPVIAAACFGITALILTTPRPQRTPALTGMAVWMAAYGA